MNSFLEDTRVQKNRWWILISVSMFTFMSTLDSSIVNVAMPVISTDLAIPMNQAEWVVSIYLIVVCACLLVFGKIGDSKGKIKVFQLGTAVFVFGSLLCGFNHSLAFLLIARVVQAVGASMTMSTNYGIITEIFPLQERGRALGLIGAFVSLGSIAGPGIGGLLLAHLSWSYIFWINIPIGLLTMVAGSRFLPKDITRTEHPIDISGFISFAIAIITFFTGIFLGQELGFLTIKVLVLLLIGVISFVVFVTIEQNKRQPLLQFHLFKNRVFSLSLITALLVFSGNFFINVVIPFYLQNALSLSPGYAGILMMVFPLFMVIGAPISGYLTDRIGPQVLVISGLLLLSITQVMYMIMDTSTPIWFYVIATGIMGFANALFQSPNNTLVMSSVEKEHLGIAGSLNSLARNLGMVAGIACSTTILYQAMSQAYGEKVTTYIQNRPDIFIYGMRMTFVGALLLYLIAFGLTILRVFRKK